MEITKLSSKNKLNQTVSSNKKIVGNFTEQFNSAAKKEREKYLGSLLESIKKKGRQIIESRNINVVKEYKDIIKEYLSLVLKDAYRVEKIRSLYDSNPSTFVSVINEELNQLAHTILVQEKDTISVVNMIEHIEGLLIDIYK